MLQTVADMLHNSFNDMDIYRIGGDEFVVFVIDSDMDITVRKLENISAYLTVHRYHISVGIHQQNLPIDTDALIKHAEKLMYEEKKSYYSSRESDGRVRA